MKLNDLRKIISEEVKKSVREELNEIFKDIGKAAVTESIQYRSSVPSPLMDRVLKEGQISQKSNINQQKLSINPSQGTDFFKEFLNQTASEITPEDMKNFRL